MNDIKQSLLTASDFRVALFSAITSHEAKATECLQSAADLEQQAQEYRELADTHRREVTELRAMVLGLGACVDAEPETQPATNHSHRPRRGGKWEGFAASLERKWPKTCAFLRTELGNRSSLPWSDVLAQFPDRPQRKRDNELAAWFHREGWHRQGTAFLPYQPGTAGYSNWLVSTGREAGDVTK